MTALTSQGLHKPDTGSFLAALRTVGEGPLSFSYDGRETQPGYHVTEVKTARFAGLDCGANPEDWTETFIQLWDVPGMPGEEPKPMSVPKFLAIIGKFERDVGLDSRSKLTFEVSDAASAIRLFAVDGVRFDAGRALVELGPVPASCKPRDRWLAEATPVACCGPQQSASSRCCG